MNPSNLSRPRPAPDDAATLVRLYHAGASGGYARAAAWVWSDAFVDDWDRLKATYAADSPERGYLWTVLMHLETVATLWRQRLLNETLLFDWIRADELWLRVGPLIPRWREDSGNAVMWENFQAMAEAQGRWGATRRD